MNEVREFYQCTREGKNQGRIAYVARRDTKAKTVILTFTDGDEESIPLSYSTLRRSWCKVDEPEVSNPAEDDNYVAEVMQQKKELGINIPKIESYTVEEVNTPDSKDSSIVKTKKSKNTTTKLALDVRKKMVCDVLDTLGFKYSSIESQPKRLFVIDAQGKKRRCFYLGDTKCVLGLPTNEVPDNIKPDRITNCPLGNSFDMDYNNLGCIESLLSKVEK